MEMEMLFLHRGVGRRVDRKRWMTKFTLFFHSKLIYMYYICSEKSKVNVAYQNLFLGCF